MLAISRTPKPRPIDFDERLRRTQEALRYVRVTDRGSIVLVERDSVAPPLGDTSAPIYPSFAVLQLYLLNDQRFDARYVHTPIQFGLGGVVDYDRSINNVKQMVRSLVAASRLVGDLNESDTAAALRRQPALYRAYPGVYVVLRTALLQRLDALRKTVLNRRMLDYIFNERWQQQPEILRVLGRVERQILEWRAALQRGGELSRQRSNEITQAIAAEVIDKLVEPLMTEARASNDLIADYNPDDAVVRGPQQPRVEQPFVKPEPKQEPLLFDFDEPEPEDESDEEQQQGTPQRPSTDEGATSAFDDIFGGFET